MGCSSSKFPTFPASSTADGIAPITPPYSDFDAQVIKFIPQSDTFGHAIGVYLPTDVGTPTYFFQPSSKGCSIKASVMASATLKLQVITKLDEDGTEHRVNIVKTYSRDSSSKVQIDEGYSIKERSSTSEAQSYLELTFNGNSIAYYIYESSTTLNSATGGSTAGAGISDAIKQDMAYFKLRWRFS
eukprot:scaffold57012_cov63-Cyclotella_meneghiniana.AAC.5